MVNQVQRVLVVGSSGHARSLINVIESDGNFTIVGLLDDFRLAGESLNGYRILGGVSDLSNLVSQLDINGIFLGVGDNFSRSVLVEKIQRDCPTLRFPSAVHAAAVLAPDVKTSDGVVIMAGALVGPNAVVEQFCIINSGACLEHDAFMAEYSSLGPNAVTGGYCRIGHHTAICIGAVLSHRVTIGEHTVIGAGSTVLKDIDANCIAYGTPARKVRHRKIDAKYL